MTRAVSRLAKSHNGVLSPLVQVEGGPLNPEIAQIFSGIRKFVNVQTDDITRQRFLHDEPSNKSPEPRVPLPSGLLDQ